MPLPPIRRWDTVARPRAAVHVVHGMSEHAGRYARFASALNEAGFIVWAHDHRGHGDNPTPPVGHGHFADADGWRAVLDDTWAVSSALQSAHPGLPLLLFAHSMGSFIGQTLIGEHGEAYAGVVLAGSNGPPRALEHTVRTLARTQLLVLGGRAPGRWVHRVVMGVYNKPFAPNRTPVDWLSRDDAEVDRHVADPRCGFMFTAQAWFDFLDGKRILGDAGHLRRIPSSLPIHLIAGTHDPVGENGDGVTRLYDVYQKAGLRNVTMRLYEEARHELVNETNRDAVTGDVVAWMNGVVG
jgi:alpha-beta hydrolase superfamily lysophospholipase